MTRFKHKNNHKRQLLDGFFYKPPWKSSNYLRVQYTKCMLNVCYIDTNKFGLYVS